MIDVKISIINSNPEIFRIIRVDENINLQLFHEVIQAAFEWSNAHSHFYKIDKKIVKNEKDTVLSKALASKTPIVYVYDLADWWAIEITLVSQNTGTTGKKPVCLQGQGKSPPEDSGGIINYCEILDLLAKHNKGDRDYPLIADWLGENYNPNEFNCEQVNQNFKNLVL